MNHLEIIFKNRNRDTAWFSIIDSEWPALKEKFEKWLHPNNFDATGKQILKLSEIQIMENTFSRSAMRP